MSILSDKEREAVAVGAAIGAGCRPCTQYHVNAALQAGLSREEVRLAVKDAEVLRIQAATGIAGYALHLLGDERGHDDRLCNPAERLQALAQIGAAAGANVGTLLDLLLPQARALGLSGGALQESVNVAAAVKKAAAGFFARDADRALGRRDEIPDASDSDGCMRPAGPQPEAAGAAPGAPAACC